MQLLLTAPAQTFTNQAEVFDCRASVGLLKAPLVDGRAPFEIDYGDGFTSLLAASGHAYRKAGSYIIKLTALSDTGEPTIATRQIEVVDIPTASAANRQMLVDQHDIFKNRALLQDAINLAASRNTSEQEIVVPAGFKAAGTIVKTAPVGDKYITIKSSASDLLKNRVTPADEQALFQILSIEGAEAFTGPTPANATNHYRFIGLKVSQQVSSIYVHHLSSIGSAAIPSELELLAHHFIFDRCWFDGGPDDRDQIRTGTSIWANHVTLCNSRFAEFRRIGSGVDTQGFGITIGAGPYSFFNNYIVATAESVNLGSGGAAYLGRATVTNPTRSSCTLSHVKNLEIDMNLALKVNGEYSVRQSTIVREIRGNEVVFDEITQAPDANSVAEWEVQPSFIEFRGNHCTKPLKWFPRHSTWNGITYQIKNLWETKFCRWAVVDGNVFENSWAQDQQYGIAITPRNGNGGESFASVVRCLQWSSNIIKNCASGINVISSDYNPGKSTQLLTDLWLVNNLFMNVGVNWDSFGAGHQMLNLQNPYGVRMKRVFVMHNTDDNGMPENANRAITDFGDSGGADDSMWLNNIHRDGGYGFWSQLGFDFTASLKKFLPPGDTNVSHNLIVNSNNHGYPVRFLVDETDWRAHFVNYDAGDFTLAPSSAGRNAATDGSDIGCDMQKLRNATRGCVSGVWGETQPTAPAPTPIPSTTPAPTPIPAAQEYVIETLSKDTEAARTSLYQVMFARGYAVWAEQSGPKLKFRKFK